MKPGDDISKSPVFLIQQLQKLNAFQGEPAEFLKELLKIKQNLSKASAAAILRAVEGQPSQVLALSSSEKIKGAQIPDWLNEAIQNHPKHDDPQRISSCPLKTGEILIFMPVKSGDKHFGTEVYCFPKMTQDELNPCIEQLQVLMPYFDFYEGRIKLKSFQEKTENLHQACEILIQLNNSQGFMEAAMRLCNEMAARFSCSRVSLGVLKGRYIHLKALSNTEKFNRKTVLLQSLEKVMEECLDQDLEILYPQEGRGDYVARDAEKYSQANTALSLVSLPIRFEAKVLAVLTFEREEERPFTAREIEVFRLVLDLYAPRLIQLYKYQRWFGARLQEDLRKSFAYLIGVKHTWFKIAFLVLIGAIIYFSQAKSMYEVEASFSFNSLQEQKIIAPFDAEIDQIFVENGDSVRKGQKLFTLDTTEQDLKKLNLSARRQEAMKKMSVAMNESKTAEVQIAKAEIKQIEAEMNLHTYNIKRSVVRSPLKGEIVADDLKKRLYSVARFGQVLAEVIQVDNLEATLFVPEDQIADVRLKALGELAAAGYPDRKVPFEVIDIKKVAEPREQVNVFRVRVKLLIDSEKQKNFYTWAHPGMEGVARIDVEERLQIWTWTRKAINYVRMKFWI